MQYMQGAYFSRFQLLIFAWNLEICLIGRRGAHCILCQFEFKLISHFRRLNVICVEKVNQTSHNSEIIKINLTKPYSNIIINIILYITYYFELLLSRKKKKLEYTKKISM